MWIDDIWWLDMVEDDGPDWALISREPYAVRRDLGRAGAAGLWGS